VTPAPVAPAKTQPKTTPADNRAATREPGVTSAKTSTSPTPATADTGDADFRKAEAYLYGRGAGGNCAEAVKYLKAASAKSNAKARSAFGTMYATGHCVQRDLPTSYLWFALALRVDPNNQILEKDLNAVWNQMTPPERQMATRMKQ
jgi:TPR repeat protein